MAIKMTLMMMLETYGKNNIPKNASLTIWTWTPIKNKKDGKKTKRFSTKIMIKMIKQDKWDS